ncbi:MAG: glutathione S-transferase N-terminal domain-containing protein, partial [Bdellovibrionota bacterium]
MKLFFSPGACSLSPHIVLAEGGFNFTTEKVDLKAGTYAGGDYSKINPKGYVPALQLDNGEVLTEGAAIVQYLADKKPEAKLIPAVGTMERARCIEWLVFIASELHKGFGPLWNPTATEGEKSAAKDRLGKRFAYVNEKLKGK